MFSVRNESVFVSVRQICNYQILSWLSQTGARLSFAGPREHP